MAGLIYDDVGHRLLVFVSTATIRRQHRLACETSRPFEFREASRDENPRRRTNWQHGMLKSLAAMKQEDLIIVFDVKESDPSKIPRAVAKWCSLMKLFTRLDRHPDGLCAVYSWYRRIIYITSKTG